jgi:hypothetical protein
MEVIRTWRRKTGRYYGVWSILVACAKANLIPSNAFLFVCSFGEMGMLAT